MSNPQQNKIQNEIEQFKREINLLQDKLKQSKNTKFIAKWTKANYKNANLKKRYFIVNQKNV